MSYSVDGKTISLTRGDTFESYVVPIMPDSDPNDPTPYVPREGDKIYFAVKRKYTDNEPLFVKEIPIDTLLLTIDPEDTEELDFGKYVFDVELDFADGKVDTFITKGTLELTEEVLWYG